MANAGKCTIPAFETWIRHFDLKCVITFITFYSSVKFSPASIKARFENIFLINLLTIFVCCAVAGHINETNFWLSVNWAKEGFKCDSLVNVQLRLLLNLSQNIKKCSSVSTNFSFEFEWRRQYLQKRWLKGVIGWVRRPSSELRQCALILSLVSDDLWFLLRTCSI